ncbi:MAG TPA: elongation factor P [Alphaproteobacteria bacterium]|nr:elongation factor P [Alphaproteobacteria bacterium]USO06233.1 MAG: elongation factor P [Rhodospirillales bacterium]HOO82849.1 elongation factor P [Alphaproteobacteria bacterium]
MKVNAITLRSGNVIDYNGKLWAVVKNDIQQPGKGASVAQVELRDIRSGSKDNVRFRTQETVERVRLEQDNYQFLFADGEDYTFMHQETFEQIVINKELIGQSAAYLVEGMIVEIETFEGEPLSVKLPDTVTVEIVEAEPVVKGQTATTSYKPAILANGEKVMVPPHIESGTRIVVKSEDGTYVERAKD